MLIPGEPFNPYKLFIGSFIPNWLMRRPELSQGAKLCYARLAQYAGEGGHAHPAQETLAKELAVSDRQVRKYVKELMAQELITTRQFGMAQTNAYVFLWHKWAEDGIRPGPELKFHSRRNHGSAPQELKFRPDRNGSSDKENQEENHKESETRVLSQKGEEADDFVTFNGVYGHCRRCGEQHQRGACVLPRQTSALDGVQETP
jgi:hypothetical protein